MAAGEAARIVAGVAAQLTGRAQDIMPQGMAGKQQVFYLVVDQLGRRVLVALDLVAHHLALLLDLMLRVLAMEHDVAQHVDRPHHVLTGDGGIVDRIFLVRERIEFAAHALQRIDDLHGRASAGALEREVFAEVGQSLLARLLVARSRPHGDAQIDHLRQ